MGKQLLPYLLVRFRKWSPGRVQDLAQAAEHVVKAELPAADADRVDEEVHEGPVGDAEGEEDTEICGWSASF